MAGAGILVRIYVMLRHTGLCPSADYNFIIIFNGQQKQKQQQRCGVCTEFHFQPNAVWSDASRCNKFLRVSVRRS